MLCQRLIVSKEAQQNHAEAMSSNHDFRFSCGAAFRQISNYALELLDKTSPYSHPDAVPPHNRPFLRRRLPLGCRSTNFTLDPRCMRLTQVVQNSKLQNASPKKAQKHSAYDLRHSADHVRAAAFSNERGLGHVVPPNALQSHAPFIQAKLEVGAVDDPLEREADAAADQVVRMPMSGAEFAGVSGPQQPTVQRKCANCENEEDQVQMKSNGSGTRDGLVGHQLHQQIQSTRGGGQTLDGQTRNFMESGFGRDFSQVKVHTNEYANTMNRELNAKAFTVGNDIYFNSDQYQPSSDTGRHLLAHELAHTVQQQGRVGSKPLVQRASYGGGLGAPATWAADVAAATTSAQKTALMRTALGSTITVNDATAASSGDTQPETTHLQPYTATSPTINYDDGLNTKRARGGTRVLSSNGGYTFNHNGTYYVVMGPLALDSSNYYQTVWLVNHELDHVRQFIAGSTLTGDSSELDAWTSSFIREFHRSYIIRENSAANCYVQNVPTYTPIQGYYERTGVPPSEKTRAITRIQTYYTSVIQPHAGHLAVFRYWVRRQMDNTTHSMVDDLNTTLSLGITSSATLASFRQFPCTGITTLTFPASPTVSLPTYPAASQPVQSPKNKP